MAKPKIKYPAMDTCCTEFIPGIWSFVTGRHAWEYNTDPTVHKNVFRTTDKHREPVTNARTLAQAVMYAHGWEAGFVKRDLQEK